MATTTPDNIKTPGTGDQYALVQDLGAMADTVQNALVKRANMYVGTSAARTAWTTAPEGVHWQDSDGVAKLEYVRRAGAWALATPRVRTGSLSFTGLTANQASALSVTFPPGLFSEPPVVMLTSGTGITTSTAFHFWVSGAVTTTGFTASLAKGSTSNHVLYWTATQA